MNDAGYAFLEKTFRRLETSQLVFKGLKILVVHNSLNDGKSMSGVLRHYLLMAKAWIADGHEVDFMVAKAAYPQIQAHLPSAGLVCSDPWFDATGYLEQTWRYLPAYALRTVSAFWISRRKSYDVVYASNLLIFEVFPAWVLSRRFKARWCVKIQHLLHGQNQRVSFFDRLFLISEKWSIWLSCRFAQGTLCLSQSVAEQYKRLLVEWRMPSNPTKVIGCGLDLSDFDPARSAKKDYDVVFLGRIHMQKGVFDLVDCWQHVLAKRRNARLLVIGEGPHRKAIMQQVRQRGLADSVTFTGSIPEKQKNQLLKQSRMGMSLSFEEGWGLSVTEMLASGLPVVAYDLPVFRELFSKVIQRVPSRAPLKVAEQILKWMESPQEAFELGRKGASFVRSFDYRTVADHERMFLESMPDLESTPNEPVTPR